MLSRYNIENYTVNDQLVVNTLVVKENGSKGRVLVGNGTDVTFLTAGTNGYILEADSAETVGVKWSEFTGTVLTTFTGDHGRCSCRV